MGLSNIYAFGGLFFLFFLKPLLKENHDFSKVGITSTIIMGVFLLLSITSLLLSFPFVTEVEQLSPLYYITSIVGSGLFFQRPESIFMLTWILAIMSYLTIVICFCILIIKKFIKRPISNGISIPIALLIYLISVLPPDIASVRQLEETFYIYSSISIVMILFFVTIILAYFKHKRNQKKESNLEHKEVVLNE